MLGESAATREVLAHELAHVVQQRFGAGPPMVARAVCVDGTPGSRRFDLSVGGLFWQIRKYDSGEIPEERQIRDGGRRVPRAELLEAAECVVAELVWQRDLPAIEALLARYDVLTDPDAHRLVQEGRLVLTDPSRGADLVDLVGRTRIWRRSTVSAMGATGDRADLQEFLARTDVGTVGTRLAWLLGRSGAIDRMQRDAELWQGVRRGLETHFDAPVTTLVLRSVAQMHQYLRSVQIDPRGMRSTLFRMGGALATAQDAMVALGGVVVAFAEGFVAGLAAGLDDRALLERLRDRLVRAAALNTVFPGVFASGAAVGMVQDAIEGLQTLAQLFTRFSETVEQLAELVRSMFEDPQVAHDFGVDAGRGVAQQVRGLDATSNLFTFTFELGRLVGPTIVYAVLSLLGVSLGAVAARYALQFTGRALVLATRFVRRVIPDPGRLVRTTLRHVDLPRAWRDVLTPDDTAFLSRTRHLDGDQIDDLSAAQELGLARRVRTRPVRDARYVGEYVEEIELPNGHTWRRAPDGTWCRFSRRKCLRRRDSAEEAELARGPYGPEHIRALRAEVVRRPRPTSVERIGHRGVEDHGVPDEVILRAIHDPQQIRVAANGNWLFYRNGTIVVTRRGVAATPGGPAQVQTAFGRGGRVPSRHRDAGRGGVGDAEAPVDLETYIDQNRGHPYFDSFRIWP